MNRTWVQILIRLLLAASMIFATCNPPEALAAVLTLLVVLAVIGVPILVGYIIFCLKVSPDAASFQDIGDYGTAWLMGITVIVFTTVIIGGILLATYGTYTYILTLLTR